MDDPFVVIAATPRAWASALHAHAADHGGVVVRATVLTAADARDERGDVLLVDDITSFLSPSLVTAVHARGRSVIGVHDAGDEEGRAVLLDAGVDVALAADTDPAGVVDAVRALAAARPATAMAGAAPPPVGRGAPHPAVDRPLPSTGPAQVDRSAHLAATSSRVIGVTGPAGGVGVTEIAIELAAVLGSAGLETVLIDADEADPSHAQRLRLPLQPNVLGGLDASRRGGDVTAGLHRLSRRHPLAALPGMSTAEDWGSVPHGALEELVSALARRRQRIVVDLGHCPPPLEGPTGPRFGHAATLAGRCTDLVLVTAPTPTAIARTLRLRSSLAMAATTVHPILNRDTGDRHIRRECLAELRHGLGVDTIPTVAEDAAVPRAAWQGERVARGRFCRQVLAAVDAWGWRQR